MVERIGKNLGILNYEQLGEELANNWVPLAKRIVNYTGSLVYVAEYFVISLLGIL